MSGGALLDQAVTNSPNGFDFEAGMLDLFAYPADVHIHGAGLHFGIELPDTKQEVVPGLYPSLALEKVMEQLEFGQGEVNFLCRDGNAMVLLIEN